MPNVLIADDSPVVRAFLENKVVAAGATVTLASCAAEAKRVDASAVDVALLDLDLGDGSGLDVAAALRARNPALRVAFFSAGSDAGERGRAAVVGPVFPKPDGVDDAVAWVTRSRSP